MRARDARRPRPRAPARRGRSVVVAAGAAHDPGRARRGAESRRRAVAGELHRFLRHRRAGRRLPERAQQRAQVRPGRGQRRGDVGAAAGAPGQGVPAVPEHRGGAGSVSRETFIAPVVALGRVTVSAVAGIGYDGMLLYESLYIAAFGWRIGQPLRIRSVFEQGRQIGVDALPIVTLMALTIGVMLGIQFIAAMADFGAQSQVVVAVAKSVTREFGALITAILVAGRSGSALAARIGSMQVSQEVDALATMGIEPVRYLAAPALLAMLVMLPLLTVLADAIAIIGAALYSSPALNETPAAYL